MLLALVFPAQAQQPKKVPHIGYLTDVGSAPAEAFVQGLWDLGYIEVGTLFLSFGRQEANPDGTQNSQMSLFG